MPTLRANGIDLCYEDFGDPCDPLVLLVMGLGAQLIFWPDAMVEGLVARGFRVVRFDNRDIGLSTHLGHLRPPSPLRLAAAVMGLPVGMPYRLRDMADDTVALLDGLGVDKAHLVGASMGGMIAQIVAAGYPDRVRSLTSIMSTSGRRGLPGPTPRLQAMLLRRPRTTDRASAVAAGVRVYKAIGAPGGRSDENLHDLIARAYDRGYDPGGVARQLGAIVADGSRVERLQRIRARTLVIHGDADPLVPLAAGRDSAAHIPGARLEIVAGMGHDLSPGVVARITALIADHIARD